MFLPDPDLKGTVLLLEKDRNQYSFITDYLAAKGHRTIDVDDLSSALNCMIHTHFDVIILSLEHPEHEIDRILKLIKNKKMESDVIITSPLEKLHEAAAYLKRGAIDFIINPINPEQLEICISKILERKKLLHAVRERDKFRELTLRDSLTGIYNNKYFYECLSKEIDYFNRKGLGLSIMMIDLDNFKTINDNYGHPAGDYVIIKLAELLKKNCRSYDIVARYGGEEFSIILPDNSSDTALKIAKRILKAVAEHTFEEIENSITVSIGISEFPEHASDAVMLVKMADIALYYSKYIGKNTYTVYRQELEREMSGKAGLM